MNILYLTFRFPYPPIRGDRIRNFYQIKELSRKHRVTVVSFLDNEEQRKYVPELARHCHEVHVVPFRTKTAVVNMTLHLFSSNPWQLFYSYSPEMQATVDSLLQNSSFDLIQVYFFRMAQYVLNSSLPKVIDFCDVLSLNYQRFRQVRRGLWKLFFWLEGYKAQKYEIEMLKSFDSILVVSTVERDFLKNALNGHDANNIAVVPNGVDTQFFHPMASEKGRDILLTASYDYYPNVDAAHYFVDRIFPLIKKESPASRFLIVGSNPPRSLVRLNGRDGIVVTGRVPDTRPYFARSAVFVCPIRMGGGFQNKIVEAMAMGIPVVSSPIGAEGLDVVPDEHILIADTPDKFTKSVLELLNNRSLYEKLALNARQLVDKKYSWERTGQELEKLYAQVLNNQIEYVH